MEFRIARAARITGERLEAAVREQLTTLGLKEPDVVICYGAGYTGPKKALNARCSTLDKMEQGETLRRELNLEAVPTLLAAALLQIAAQAKTKGPVIPLIARKVKHSKGKDILVCKTWAALKRAIARGREYVTLLQPSDTEFRVWVYRNRVLCAYEKRLTEPEKNLKFGRNRANGWTFHHLTGEQIPESLRRVSVSAVKVLGLDFGAVDVLGTWDAGHHDIAATVLEVNSAPGVSDEHRTGFVKLATRVVKWIANGCPDRAA